ncbi:major Facilitator Superfamily protein [Burkholderia thailandensis MSMB121]|uniref:MFS transporter n=1 Tax=Burkholderia TaxID=32008 RepID=UPI0003280772|nr:MULTISPECIES: MFS transporter [Burkholderia]AGK49916.1 major Facilitator Superfamily protein [Burkholderia thailandensis MSMB121]ATF33949.1 MFS transporter [Burkholderia thailandensis]KST72028.1 MFS transporter [Burkholderia humptydooensis]
MKRYLPYWSYYAHQGMVSALTMQGVVGYFRHAGADLAQLSWLSLAMLPWVGKFLWAPWCERHALPLRGNRYQGSLALLQLGMAALIACIGLLPPAHAAGAIVVSLMLLSLLSASHGIYANGIAICTTDARSRPFANVAQVGGSYLGIPLGSFLFLAIAERAGWRCGFAGIAALSLLLLIPSLLIRQPMLAAPVGSARPRLHWRDLRGIGPVLALTAIYLVAMRGLMALQTVLLVDAGLGLSALGEVVTIYSTVASGAGIALGGWAMRRFGAWRCVLPVMLSFPLLAGVLAIGYPRFGIREWTLAFGFVNVAAAIGFVTLYNVLMGLTRPHQPASDYALFQSTDMAVAMLMSMAVLRVSHAVGYRPVLALLAALAVASLWPAIRLCRRLAQPAAPAPSPAANEPSLETSHG